MMRPDAGPRKRRLLGCTVVAGEVVIPPVIPPAATGPDLSVLAGRRIRPEQRTARGSTPWTIRACLVNSRLGFESPRQLSEAQLHPGWAGDRGLGDGRERRRRRPVPGQPPRLSTDNRDRAGRRRGSASPGGCRGAAGGTPDPCPRDHRRRTGRVVSRRVRASAERGRGQGPGRAEADQGPRTSPSGACCCTCERPWAGSRTRSQSGWPAVRSRSSAMRSRSSAARSRSSARRSRSSAAT